jgi:uncharacterized membrane protein YdbT with pleckstrin-like domain
MSTSPNERVLCKVHPAMFRKHPILFLITLGLVFVYGLGLVILFVWWLLWRLTVAHKVLIVTNHRTIYRHGLFSRDETEIPHSQVGTINIHQGFFESIVDIGSIAIASAGTSGFEITVSGLPSPNKIKLIIDRNQYQ